MDTKKKKQAIEYFKGLIETLEKDSVEIKESNIEIYTGHAEGVDPDDYSWKTHHPDGHMNININLSLYDSETDKSKEAYIPTIRGREFD